MSNGPKECLKCVMGRHLWAQLIRRQERHIRPTKVWQPARRKNQSSSCYRQVSRIISQPAHDVSVMRAHWCRLTFILRRKCHCILKLCPTTEDGDTQHQAYYSRQMKCGQDQGNNLSYSRHVALGFDVVLKRKGQNTKDHVIPHIAN